MRMSEETPMFEKLKSLGLDDKQMAEVKAIHFGVKKDSIKKRADMQVAEVELREILSKDPVDLKAAETKVRLIESLRGDIRIMHLKAHEEIRSKLSPEQRKKFDDMMPMMHGGMMGKMGKGRMMGEGPGCGMCGMCGMMGGCMMGPDDEYMMHGDHPCATQDKPAEHRHKHRGK